MLDQALAEQETWRLFFQRLTARLRRKAERSGENRDWQAWLAAWQGGEEAAQAAEEINQEQARDYEATFAETPEAKRISAEIAEENYGEIGLLFEQAKAGRVNLPDGISRAGLNRDKPESWDDADFWEFRRALWREKRNQIKEFAAKGGRASGIARRRKAKLRGA